MGPSSSPQAAPAPREIPRDPSVSLANMLLYLLARVAVQGAGEELRVPLLRIHYALEPYAVRFAPMRLTLVFERNPVYSRQVEAALNHLIPFDLEVENPVYSVVLPKAKAQVQLELLEPTILGEDKQRLDAFLPDFLSTVREQERIAQEEKSALLGFELPSDANPHPDF